MTDGWITLSNVDVLQIVFVWGLVFAVVKGMVKT